jgi:two-component system CheB/CheR fusion protein
VKKLHTYLLHTCIVLAATLIVATITISSLYYGLLGLVDSGVIKEISIDDIQASFFRVSAITLVTAFLVAISASIMYFRITRPWAQQAETFHVLAKTAHEAIFLIDVSGTIQFVNPAAEILFGYKGKELLGKNIKQLMPSPHRELHDSYIRDYLQTGIKNVIGKGRQLLGQRKDGSQFPMYLSVGEIKLEHTHLFAGLIMDLSVQQKLQREILAIPAREQQRIGEELHDGLGQQLTGLSMLAQSLLNKSSESEHELAQVRALARGLVPIQIYADGFMISLKEITESIERQSQIPIKLQIDDVVLFFDDATATHLYRIVQESLNNAVKHAKADQISVSLKIEKDHGVLEIIDNGIGIPLDLEDSSGLGLSIMKHRCGLFYGEITINPAGDRGTKVCCRFPITPEEAIDG